MAKWVGVGLSTLLAMVSLGAEAETFALVNGRIFTQNERQPWAKAMVVEGERIAYVGDPGGTDWRRLVGPATAVYDLRNRLVVPGFVDAHTHPGAMLDT